MHAWHKRFPTRIGLRGVATIALAGALALPTAPAAAQAEVQSGPIAATPANCVIQLSVGNPNPGNQEIPRSLVMTGTAVDTTATSGSGISRVEAFVGNRDLGGTSIGIASFTPGLAPGAWSLNATFPTNTNGGQELFVYGQSSVSGQEAMVAIPIVVNQTMATPTVPSSAESFCPAVVPTAAPTAAPAAAAPTAAPTAAATAQPTATAAPAVATATPQATATPAAPAATPTAPPATATSAPAAATAPAPIQLSISSPPEPLLTFDTTTLTAAAGAQVTVTFTNNEAGILHNWHVFNGPDSTSGSLAATQLITGPGTMDSVTFTAPTQTGNYFFWCDVHTAIMTGTFVVQ